MKVVLTLFHVWEGVFFWILNGVILMIRSILDALSERVKNPWLGSIFFVFIGINWQPLMHLFFADKVLEVRFDYFHDETNFYTLLLQPIVVGFVISVVKPILSFAYYWITKHPNQWNQSQFWKQKESNLNSKIEFEKLAQNFVEEYSKTAKKLTGLDDNDQAEIKQTLSKVRDGAASSSKPMPNLNAFFKEHNLPEKTAPDIMRGTAQYLTECNGTFTEGELKETLTKHDKWEIKMKSNQAKNIKTLKNTGKIVEKTSGNYSYRE
jgi:hypothetical protein